MGQPKKLTSDVISLSEKYPTGVLENPEPIAQRFAHSSDLRRPARRVADPASELAVFAEQTGDVRDEAIAVWRAAVAVPEVPEPLRDLAALGLWALNLGLMLYFVWDGSPRQARLGLAEAGRLLAEVRSEPRIIRMILLAGATSFFVGTAFQAQMPEYAHHHGSEDADVWYSVLFGANAAGAVIGAIVLETVAILQGGVRGAIVCAAIWGAVMAIFPFVHGYAAAVAEIKRPKETS